MSKRESKPIPKGEFVKMGVDPYGREFVEFVCKEKPFKTPLLDKLFCKNKPLHKWKKDKYKNPELYIKRLKAKVERQLLLIKQLSPETQLQELIHAEIKKAWECGGNNFTLLFKSNVSKKEFANLCKPPIDVFHTDFGMLKFEHIRETRRRHTWLGTD